MVLINGEQINVYYLDTLSTFKRRIALKLNTLPDFLYFSEKLKLSDIENNNKRNIIVIDYYSKVKDKIKDSNNIKNSLKEIIKDLLDKNYSTKYIRDNFINMIFSVIKNSGKNISKAENEEIKNFLHINDILSEYEYDIINKKSKEELFTFQVTNKKSKEEEEIEKFESIENKIYTETYVYSKTISVKLIENRENKNLLDYFDDIILSEIVPYATLKNYYKIFNRKTDNIKWSKSFDDKIIVKLNHMKNINKNINKNLYTDIKIYLDKDTNNLIADIEYINENKLLISQKDIINIIYNIFQITSQNEKQIKEKDIKVSFYIPNQKLNKYVYSDLALNNNIFKRLVSIDDHDKATKNKPAFGIYIHFYHPQTGFINATITETKYNSKDIKLLKEIQKKEDLKHFKKDMDIIRVKVKNVKTSEALDKFKIMISKLFTVYNQEESGIIKIYKKYIPKFIERYEKNRKNIQETDKRIKILSEIEPDIFASNFSTICGKQRSPTIIDDKNLLKDKKEGVDYIVFPRNNNDSYTINYPSDSKNQKYYICNDKNNKYPGIIENNYLSNKDNYPFLPCCFAKKQTKKPIYKKYYFDIHNTNNSSNNNNDKSSSIVSAGRLANNGDFGFLPKVIDDLFKIIQTDKKYQYLRNGVKKSTYNFIECIVKAKSNNNTKDETFLELREKISSSSSSKNYIPLCKQELYDFSEQEIKNIIKDNTKYLDPKLFTSMLENIFDCNIILFSNNGEIVLPRFFHTYYKYHTDNTKYIYLFTYSDDNYKTINHCEIICKWAKLTGNVQYTFTKEEAQPIINMFNKTKKSFTPFSEIFNIDFPLNKNKNIDPVSQYIDSYGKTRQINYRYRDNNNNNTKYFSLLTEPLPPIKIKTETNILYESENNIDNIIKILQPDVKDVKDTIKNNYKMKEFIIGNVKVAIPIEKTQKDFVSDLEIFNTNKKISENLVYITLWFFSKYLDENNINDLQDNKHIYDFFENKTIINKTHKYLPYENKLDLTNKNYFNNNNLIINSEELKKRLIFVLQKESTRNSKKVLNFKNKKEIKKKYKNFKDFTIRNLQTIIYGSENVKLSFIKNKNITIFNKIQPELQNFYFIKNNNYIYLAKNLKNINENNYISSKKNSDLFEIKYSKTDSEKILIKYNFENKTHYTLLTKQNSDTLK